MLTFHGFEWDFYNENKILEKHGIKKEEVEDAINSDVLVLDDIKHSTEEKRFLGLCLNWNRPLLAVFTLRTEDKRILIRVISARYMHRKEIEKYEKNTKV